ncbi:hypothetical protein EC957_007573 [Mortierella hygrophila]|uniref:RRM domain-containing protein n=1 Tax=Mortierella hygrophila TaxID=979708 RepID=A0A9P6JXZ4_9FUNG|nr:hypothetical protein EC957_007573 [Mortierella hygrophila]
MIKTTLLLASPMVAVVDIIVAPRVAPSPRRSAVNKVFIFNLPLDTTDKFIRDKFNEVGQVTEAIVMRDGDGRSRGFGLISYSDNEGADAAIAKFNGQEFDGRPVKVDRASEASKGHKGYHSDQQGGYNAGSSGGY